MAVVLRDIFKNDIQRKINGVISAGKKDNGELNVEFSEYVVTNDVKKGLDEFFEYYNDAKPSKNGVWISGFFGSGKSHLLKILSYLLENGFIDGKSCFSYFEQKLSEDPILLGNIKKGCSIPSESILFNIIQNNSVDKNGNPESILPIFLRQFYEHQGYYGADPVIAEMESQLDEDGLLDKFIECFETISGKEWKVAREKKNINRRDITRAFAEVTGQTVDNDLLKNFDNPISILGFAEKVKRYINSKGKDFRLNFFVDEAGQFVVKDARLMVELQEIATALSDKCNNKAWIIVTSQDQLDQFIGKIENKISKDDFSKIQGRFYVKLKLTNQNVDEVIQKRLLLKNYEGKQFTSMIYSSKKDNFDALFGFVNGPKHFRCYRDENEFVNTYPFVTYQFDLFKTAFTELSNHGAFPGEYTSTGARSLLDIFHRVLNMLATGNYCSSSVPVVPFDAFYEGIEDNLMDNFKQSIYLAQNNIGAENPFAIRVLKAMLLVKYIPKDFKSTAHNISTLLLTSFDENTAEVNEKTQNALNLLESQTYIQRKNTDEYDFLTNDEKDIETEIKREIITDDKIYDFLSTTIYRRLLSAVSKAKDEYGNTFPITKQIDDRTFTAKQELGLVVVTSYAGDVETAPFKYSDNELVVALKDDGKLFTDIILSLQTDRYISIHNPDTFTLEKKLAVEQKRTLNNTRKENIENAIVACLQNAELYIAGVPLHFSPSSNLKSRVDAGLTALVEKVYVNLPMIGNKVYNDIVVAAAFTDDISDMYKQDSEAENQILSRISLEKRKGTNTTIKTLVDYFGKIPYGWPAQAVLYYVVLLFRKGKLEVKQNGLELSPDKLKSSINQTMQWLTLMLETVVEIDSRKVKDLKTFYLEFVSKPCSSDNAKDVVRELNNAFESRLRDINKYTNVFKYPFLRALEEERITIENCMNKSHSWYFDSFLGYTSEKLLDMNEDIVNPCLKFMETKERSGKYDEAYDLLQKHQQELNDSNKSLWQPIKDILHDPYVFRKSDVSKLPGLCANLTQYFSNELLEKKQKSLDEINKYKVSLPGNDEYALLGPNQKDEVENKIRQWIDDLKNATTKDAVGAVMYFGKEKIDNFIISEAYKFTTKPVAGENPHSTAKRKSISNLNVMQKMSDMNNKKDVEMFIADLRTELEKVIDDGFVIGR